MSLSYEDLVRRGLHERIKVLEASNKDLIEALTPFAAFACDEPHVGEAECHNCRARRVITEATS